MTTTIRQAWTIAPTIEASLDGRKAVGTTVDGIGPRAGG